MDSKLWIMDYGLWIMDYRVSSDVNSRFQEIHNLEFIIEKTNIQILNL